MKPDPEYFRSVLKEIQLPANKVLFLDDHEVNVASARQVGLRAEVFAAATGLDTLCRTLRSFGVAVP